MDAITLLLIDDEEAFVTTLAKRLRKRGFLVLQAQTAQAGLELLEQHKDVEIVLLDVRMPDLDGIRTLRTIRLNFPQVEVIILSGHLDAESAIATMGMGAFRFLTKPVELPVLLETVGRAARKYRER